jgi:hypothetical protein
LYVFGYSAYRIFEESLRIDSSVYFLGLRLNMYIASALTVVGAVWFYRSQRRPLPDAPAADAAPVGPAADATAAGPAVAAEPAGDRGAEALKAAGTAPGEEPQTSRDSGQAAPGPG